MNTMKERLYIDSRTYWLLMAVRAAYTAHQDGSLAKNNPDWIKAVTQQSLAKEAVIYLASWDQWTKEWRPPKRTSLAKVKRLLEEWTGNVGVIV